MTCAGRSPADDRLGNGHLDACYLDPAQKKNLRETAIHPELAARGEPELTEESR